MENTSISSSDTDMDSSSESSSNSKNSRRSRTRRIDEETDNSESSRDSETSAKKMKLTNDSLKEKHVEGNNTPNKTERRKMETISDSSSDTDADISASSSNSKNSRRSPTRRIDEETAKKTKQDEHSVCNKPRGLSWMWKTAVPDNILEKLKCSFCGEYLSQLPIYFYQGQDNVTCGRCRVLSEENAIRNVPYEAVAQYLLFPCRYKPYGCLDNVISMHMRSHEESCLYKQYSCPCIPVVFCPWQGPSNELFAHYEENHNVLAVDDSTFEIDLINAYENNFLLIHGKEIFIINVKCDAKVFWCSVRYNGSKKVADQFLFQLELKKHNGIENIKFPKKSIDCDGNINLDKNTAVHFDAVDIRKALDDPCAIICNVKILPNEPDFTNIANGSNGAISATTASEDINEDLLRELECPVCNEYMVPPIHQCVAGHSICSVCKIQVAVCPTCQNRIEDTRNYTLENMTRHIKVCCKYRDFDCPFVSTSDKIRQHETECKFGPYECPLRGYNDCQWKGKLVDIMDHAKSEHEDNILEIGVVTFPFQVDGAEDKYDCFIMKAYGKTFKLIFKYETSTFYWSVQYIGPAEDSDKYMFELDIVDCSESTQRLLIKRKCNPLMTHEEAFNNEASFIHLAVQTLQPMMNDCGLIYKCHVVKK